MRNMARAILFLFIVAASIFSASSCAAATSAISPGRCVGKICLGDSRSLAKSVLGEPSYTHVISKISYSDIWASKGNYLFLIFDKDRLTDIHVTSSKFIVACGVSSKSDFSEVKACFPNGVESDYVIFGSGKNRVDWVDINNGITFTFAGDQSGPIVRIAIHRPGVSKRVGYSEGDEWYWYP